LFRGNVFIEDVALLRNEACFRNQVTQTFFRGPVVSAGGRHHIFFDHNRAHIICAEPQSDLAETQSLRQPRGLDIVDVVHEQARNREHLEVIHSCRLFLDPAAERRVLALKSPWDESKEAARLVLKIANSLQVADAMLDCVANTEHHRGR
jgi:hypothetical protein